MIYYFHKLFVFNTLERWPHKQIFIKTSSLLRDLHKEDNPYVFKMKIKLFIDESSSNVCSKGLLMSKQVTLPGLSWQRFFFCFKYVQQIIFKNNPFDNEGM